MREGWLIKRRVDQDRTAAHRVYARLTEDALLWHKSPEEESVGGVLLLGRCAVHLTHCASGTQELCFFTTLLVSQKAFSNLGCEL